MRTTCNQCGTPYPDGPRWHAHNRTGYCCDHCAADLGLLP